MKKWTIVTLLALLTALLFCSACAEGDHNWVWEQEETETTHIRYCDGCTAYNHTNRVVDSTSHGNHAYICKWPSTEPQNVNGFIEIGLECNSCSKPQRAKAQMISGSVPTCRQTGSHTYEYADSYATAKYDSETKHTYTVPTVNHKFDEYRPNHDATCTQNGTETAKCRYSYDGCTATDTREIPNSMLRHDIQQHAAKAPTCTESGWNAYETCSRCGYNTYEELPALWHSYESEVIKPTCTKGGYTLHTCLRCGDSYADEKTSKRSHWFGEWAPDTESAESIHLALCRRDCGYTGRVECMLLDYALRLEGDENAYAFSLCPVCGRIHDEIRLVRVEKAAARAVNKSSVLPAGELTVRMGALENGETILSVCFERSGIPTQPAGKIRITLPAEPLTGCTLALLNADGTQTPLDFTANGKTIAFSLDFANGQSSVQLIHVVPAS